MLPILDQLMRDADAIGWGRLPWQRRSESHWHDHVYVPPLGSESLQMGENLTNSGYSYKHIQEIVQRIYGYPWLASWFCG